MNAFRRFVVALFLSGLLVGPLFANIPPMGVYKGARGGSTASAYSDYVGLHQFETWFGHQVPRAIEFIDRDSWANFDGSAAWVTNQTSGWPPQRWRVTYSVPIVVSGSTLAQGATGIFDFHFTNLANLLVAAGEGDAIIRLGWEMNGTWYPWTVLSVSDADNYKACWVRIVNAMRAVPGANFKFDFCPTNGQPSSYASYHSYPGDAYVDIIGLDVYNTSYSTTDPATRWNELVNTSYGLKYWADFAALHTKQLSYPEWATGVRTHDSSGGGDDPLFIQKMHDWIGQHNVAYHNYWDYQADDFHGQLSNGQFPNAAAQFLALFGADFSTEVAAPENLSAEIRDTQVALVWAPVSGATNYNIRRSTTIGHTFSAIGTSTGTNYADTGLTNGTVYYYTVTAMSGGLESGPSMRVAAKPLNATIVDDSALTGVTVSGAWTSSTSGDGYYGVDYLHDANTGNTVGKSVRFTPNLPAAGSYTVYTRWTSGSNRATNTQLDITHALGTGTFTLNQQNNGAGWVSLGTFDFNAGTAGNVLIANTGANGYVVADAVAFIAVSAPQPPAIPTGLIVTPTDSQVTLSWSAVPGATTYTVKSATASAGPYTTIATGLTSTSVTDTGLINGLGYYYTVSASNLVDPGADSIPVVGTPIGPPIAPLGLTAAAGDSQVTLAWTGSPGASNYSVGRSLTAGGPYTTIGSGVTTTTFVDTGLTNLTTYYYVVWAVNPYGQSSNTAEVNARPQAQFIVDNADVSGVTITGSWTVSTTATTYYGTNYIHDANTGGAGGKSVRFAPNFPWAASADVYLRWPAGSTRASNTPVDVNHSDGITTFSVDQRNNDGVWVLLGRFNFSAGNAGNVTIRNDAANGFVMADAAKFVIASILVPAAPTGLTATSGNGQVLLSWTGSSGATSYNVKRATTSGGPYTTLASAGTSTSYNDTGLTNGTTYSYVVTAVSSGGESGNSTEASATAGATAVTITSVSSGKSYALGSTAVGNGYTIDRSYTITALSSLLTNRTMIRTAYDDKSLTAAAHLTFSLGQAADVYVCYDTRVTVLPAFLDATWTLTTEAFSTSHTLASPFKVYRKSFSAGPVTLGANLQPPAASSWGATAAHYGVIFVPTP